MFNIIDVMRPLQIMPGGVKDDYHDYQTARCLSMPQWIQQQTREY